MNIRSYTSIADLFSIANASSGFLSIIMASMGDLVLAAKFMLIAVIFDSIDGWVARKIKREDESGFGRNMDSLSDIVSFGVAPGMLLYISCMQYGITYVNMAIALLVVICGILRLSRFNVTADLYTDKFIGLPIPTAALILGTFYLSGFFREYLALLIMILVSLLMISTFEYPKIRDMRILLVGSILLIATLLPQKIISYVASFPVKLLFVIVLLYLLAVPIIELYNRFFRSGPNVR
ncbi:MAG: archaetidylserine synthase [Methanobacterium sp.]|nr:archaetidylserine synthase [Methanobacterium sp.]